MGVTIRMAALAVQPLVYGACKAVGFEVGTAAIGAVGDYLNRHFTDQSQNLNRALQQAHDRTWKAVELSLAGESWLRSLSTTAEDRALAGQIRGFIEQAEADAKRRESLRKLAMAELKDARKRGMLAFDPPSPDGLARDAGQFARYTDPDSAVRAEHAACDEIGAELDRAGYEYLARWVAPADGPALVAVAVRYFFRRAVEENPKLSQGLAFARMERLRDDQERAFAGLNDALSAHAERLENLLAAVQAVVVETRDAVLDIRAEQQIQGRQFSEIYQAVADMQRKLDQVHSQVRPRDSLSIRGESERRLVKDLVARYRSLPESQRDQMPALLNAVGQLEVAAGEFGAAQRDFEAVAALVGTDSARGEAHINAYQAALENRDFSAALRELNAAVGLDPGRFAPFPFDKYRPQRILGAGGFGVAFLCQHAFLNAPVVVKTLQDDELDRGVDEIFSEAQVLRQVDHPAIIRVQDGAYADAGRRKRPYIVMDYFDGMTLEDHVRKNGPLSADDLQTLMRPVAEGLKAAHAKGILHRDVKPANLLVRPGEGGTAAPRFQAKLIDFGLAMRPQALRDTQRSGKTLSGSSIAGTIDYAAPEQMGKIDAQVSPASDVYGFAKTCCFALFQTTNPLMKHWTTVPRPLADLLNRCLEESPTERPRDGEVLARCLNNLSRPADVVEVVPVARAATPSSAGRRERRPEPEPETRRNPPPPPRRGRRRLTQWVIALTIIGLVVGLPAYGLYYVISNAFRGFGAGGGGMFGKYARNDTVTVEVVPALDDDTAAAFEAKLKGLTGSPDPWSKRDMFFAQQKFEVAPMGALGIQKFADKINNEFGPVVTRNDEFFRTIHVDGRKVPLVPPESPVSLADAQAMFPSGRSVSLGELKPFAIRNGHLPVRFDGGFADKDPHNPNFGKAPEERMITLNGKQAVGGISMHPPDRGSASCWFRLGKAAKTLTGTAAINDSVGSGVSEGVTFDIVGDTKVLWTSKPLKKKGDTEPFTVDVTNVDMLRLRTYVAGSHNHAHAVWVVPAAN